MKKLLFGMAAFAGVAGLRLLGLTGGNNRWKLNVVAMGVRLGLEPTANGMGLEGVDQGRRVRVFVDEHSGRGPVLSNIEVRPATSSDFGLLLTPESVVTRAVKLLGWREAKLQEPDFDRAWFVRTNDPEFLRSALTDEMRAQLVAERSSRWNSRFRIELGRVQYGIVGDLADADLVAALERQLPLLHALADVLEVHAAHQSARHAEREPFRPEHGAR